ERLAQEAEEKKKQEEEARRQKEEQEAQEVARIKALEEAKLRELERLAQEAEEKKKQEEEARRQKEEQDKNKEVEKEKPESPKEEKGRQEDKKPQPEPGKKEEVSDAGLSVSEVLPEERVCSGAMILKALDSLIGGSKEINEIISRAIGSRPEDTVKLTESLLFRSLFSNKDSYSFLGDMVGVRYPREKLAEYYAQISQITDIGSDVVKIISNVFTEAKGVKVGFSDGSVINLDGRLYSSWPATRFPYDFSNIVNELKKNLNNSFLQGQPLVLFSPPGYDVFPKDFFSFLFNIESKDIYPESLILFGNQMEELEKIPLSQEKRCGLVFGLWPWQFNSSRKVKKIGEFSLNYVKEIDRDLYLGDIEIDVFRASLNQKITLKGCAVKTDPKEKIRLVILSSDEDLVKDLGRLAGTYLNRWPNFEEAFHDFSRKIELFTYAGAEQKFFSREGFGLSEAGATMELTEIFATYMKILDSYLRWHFLPPDYSTKDIAFTNDSFYKIPVKLVVVKDRVKVKTLVSQEYQFLRDLEYLNSRMNERQISAPEGRFFWFESAFK
ncbi:MAG: hypothetical protein WC066_05235, partial [Candidatus Omnitrophota bacterium]